mmetsp:Transcript_11486/g.22952  ORF Transcript_11486/g.22952 Transcript_11486/m.22952 type:complete len:266 (+) Transcript_11486:271-1068(+)
MEVTYQGSNITGRVWLSSPLLGILEGINVCLEFWAPSLVVSFVESINLTFLWNLDIWMREDILSNQWIKGESPHSISDGQHEDGRRRVQDISCHKELISCFAHIEHALLHHGLRVIHIINAALFAWSIDSENGTDRDSSVDVGGSIQRIKDNNIVPREGFLNSNWLVFLLRGNHSGTTRGTKAVGEDFVGNNIELLLILSLHVLFSSKSCQVGNTSTVDKGSNLLARCSDGRDDGCQLIINNSISFFLEQPARQCLHRVVRSSHG